MKETATISNILSIDLEDWYHGIFSLNYRWDGLEERVAQSTTRVLDILDEKGVKATFFVLAVVAERNPDLVRLVASRGHEIGTHGYSHRLISEMSPERFADDVQRSVDVIGSITGKPILGYRAPAFSVTLNTPWIFTILKEKGFRYDASVFPTRNPLYGIPGAHRFPHKVKGVEGFVEVPGSTVRILGRNIPVCGGFYLRAAPYGFTRWAVRRINAEGSPAVVYVHPWDFDPDQPRPRVTVREALTHYFNLAALEAKFRRLLDEFPFSPACSLLDDPLVEKG